MTSLNLSWITKELAIGGWFAGERIVDLVRDHRVGAVIDLRAEMCDDELALGRHGIAFLSLPTLDHDAIDPRMLRDGIAFAMAHIDAGRRVLAHCDHGIGRSALLALCVLVDRGHPPLAALELAKQRRMLVSPTPTQLAAWSAWLRDRGIRPPTFEQLASIAYRHLGAR